MSIRFVWFWTFWHWSKESFRDGALLRGPLQGVGSHWDEWFRHEASAEDRHAIEEVGRKEPAQRQFMAWMFRHWARETAWPDNRLVPRFVLGQLAQVPPFNQWRALTRYRGSYGTGGVAAVVLAEESPGEAADVRPVEALLLPAEAGASVPPIVSEDFTVDPTEIEAARAAAGSALGGRALLAFLGGWVLSGRRPYPGWLEIALTLGWATAGGMIIYLLVGPDPHDNLVGLVGALTALWCALMLVAVTVVGGEIFRAWRRGRRWKARLLRDHVRLRMPGGLTLRGGSAGLAFSLNVLLAVHRADATGSGSSWLWRRFFRQLRTTGPQWAATGVITGEGHVKPVLLESKVRACLQHERITNLLTPRQSDSGPATVAHVAANAQVGARTKSVPASHPAMFPVRLGFAAEEGALKLHRCGTLAQAMLAIGRFGRVRQAWAGALAVAVSLTLTTALPDMRNILTPPPAPVVVPPSSPSPYHLWVSLDTAHPSAFRVVLQSDFWANRIANVESFTGVNASNRAEIVLHRRARQTSFDEEDGQVWVERRRHFLQREFAAGERVGHYSFSYVTRLPNE